jgi:hypothetical protein
MADTSVPKAMEGLAISKTKELKGTEKRDTLIEIEKVEFGSQKYGQLRLLTSGRTEIPAEMGRGQGLRG